MAFLITLGTAPAEAFGFASLTLRFLSAGTRRFLGDTTLHFDERARTDGLVVDLSETPPGRPIRSYPLGDFAEGRLHDDFKPVSFDLDAELRAENGHVGFALESLRSNDALHVVRLSQRYFLGHIFHGKEPNLLSRVTRRCIAKCADGKTAHDCVTCSRDGITVKVCC